MAVHYNEKEKKVIIEIETDLLNAPDEIRSRKQAVLELIDMAEEDRINKGTIYWALRLVNDLEPTEEQYKSYLKKTN